MALQWQDRGSVRGPQGEQGPPGQNLTGYGVEVMARQVGMAWWRQALGRRALNQVSIFAMGSSTTAGWNATELNRRWVERLVKRYQVNYNPPGVPGGTMYRPGEPNGTTTGTTSVLTEGLGLQSLSLSAGATWTITVGPTTGFDVMFRQGPGSGTFQVRVDSGTAVTVTPSTTGTAGRQDGVYSTPVVTAGSHQITITATNACVINAVYARNGDESTGIRMYNSGAGATLAADFANSTTLYQRLGQLGPNLVPIMMGANDYDLDTPIATFKANLKSIIAKSKQALIDYGRAPATYLLIGTYARFDPNVSTTLHPWSAYLAAMNDVANEDPVNVAFMNVSVPYPTSQAADPYDVIHGDSLHMTDVGHGMMADLIYESLVATPQIVVGPVNNQPQDLGQVSRRAATNQAMVPGNQQLVFGTVTASTVHASSTATSITLQTAGMWLVEAFFGLGGNLQVMIWIASPTWSGTRLAQNGAFTSTNGNVSAVMCKYFPAGTVIEAGCWVSAAATASAGDLTHFAATLIRTG